MGVVETHRWLKESFEKPIEICGKISTSTRKKEPEELYRYLLQFGIYKPNRDSQKVLEQLIANNTWEKISHIQQKYKNKWAGPDIPIYIFPLESRGRFAAETKSGVAFQDKLFLFLSEIEDEKELEALFIHEYHHVCRMRHQKTKVEEYTLLDSMIMEGLAEDAVEEHLGKAYLAKSSSQITQTQLKQLWEKYLIDYLTINKKTTQHDKLLFGKGFLPNMLGYTCGYNIVRTYRKKKHFSTKTSFAIPANKFLDVIK